MSTKVVGCKEEGQGTYYYISDAQIYFNKYLRKNKKKSDEKVNNIIFSENLIRLYNLSTHNTHFYVTLYKSSVRMLLLATQTPYYYSKDTR